MIFIGFGLFRTSMFCISISAGTSAGVELLESRHYDECHFLNYGTYCDLNLYEVGAQSCPPLYSFGPVVRPRFILHYVYRGKGTLTLDGKAFPVRGGQIFLLPPNMTTFYQADGAEPWSYIWLHFDGAKAAELLHRARLTRTAPVFQPKNSRNRLADCMEEILRSHDDELFCIGALYRFFSELLKNAGDRDGRTEQNIRLDYIQPVLDFISVKYSEPIRVQDLAGLCGLERSYLTRIFKEETGHSPREYLEDYRMKVALTLLKDPGISVGYVANSVGYTDPFSFSKAFKRRTGIAPARYRRLAERGEEIPDGIK